MIIFSCYAKVREFISVNGVLKIFNSVHGHGAYRVLQNASKTSVLLYTIQSTTVA